LWHSGLSSLLTIDRGSYRLRFYPSAGSATLWLEQGRESSDERVFRSLLRDGDTVIDVGANIGNLSLLASTLVGPEGKVFAIEAHPRTHSYLVGNIELNRASNVIPIHAACGCETGTVNLSENRSDDQNAVATTGVAVPLRRLDDIIGLQVNKRIALLKIDVEGYEKFVLEGASQLLARTDAVYFESWNAHFSRYQYSLQEVLALLRRFGFEVSTLSGNIVDESYESTNCENLLAARVAVGARIG